MFHLKVWLGLRGQTFFISNIGAEVGEGKGRQHAKLEIRNGK
jgi:hypothetical protein